MLKCSLIKVFIIMRVLYTTSYIPNMQQIIEGLPNNSNYIFPDVSRWDEIKHLETAPDSIIKERIADILDSNLSSFDNLCKWNEKIEFSGILGNRNILYGKTLIYIAHCFTNEIPEKLTSNLNLNFYEISNKIISNAAADSVCSLIDNGHKFIENFENVDPLKFAIKLDFHAKLIWYAFCFANNFKEIALSTMTSDVKHTNQINELIKKESRFYEPLKESEDLIQEFEALELLIYSEINKLNFTWRPTQKKGFQRARIFLKLALLNENESLKKIMVEVGLIVLSFRTNEFKEELAKKLENLEIVKKIMVNKFGESKNARRLYSSYILLKTAFGFIFKQSKKQIEDSLNPEILDDLDEYLNIHEINSISMNNKLRKSSNPQIENANDSHKQIKQFKNHKGPKTIKDLINDNSNCNYNAKIRPCSWIGTNSNQNASSKIVYANRYELSDQPCSSGLNNAENAMDSQMTEDFRRYQNLSKTYKRKANEMMENQQSNPFKYPETTKNVFRGDFSLLCNYECLNHSTNIVKNPENYSEFRRDENQVDNPGNYLGQNTINGSNILEKNEIWTTEIIDCNQEILNEINDFFGEI